MTFTENAADYYTIQDNSQLVAGETYRIMDLSQEDTTHFVLYYGQFTVPASSGPAFFTSQIPSIPGFSAGSISMSGASSPSPYSYVTVANNNDPDFSFAVNEPFTIEWFQYIDTTKPFARSFSIGSYGSGNIKIGVSYENTVFLWVNGGARSFAGISSNQWMTGSWIHIAIVRADTGVVRIYINGQFIGSTIISDAIPVSNLDLAIGNETVPNDAGIFAGKITNFRWVKGNAIYTANFDSALPTTPLTAVAGTKLLLLAASDPLVTADSSGLSKVVTGHNITWAAP